MNEHYAEAAARARGLIEETLSGRNCAAGRRLRLRFRKITSIDLIRFLDLASGSAAPLTCYPPPDYRGSSLNVPFLVLHRGARFIGIAQSKGEIGAGMRLPTPRDRRGATESGDVCFRRCNLIKRLIGR